MARRARGGSRIDEPTVMLTPLIDAALTLLIIFMVATPMMKNAIKVSLPEGSSKEATGSKQELVVYVDAQERLFLGDQKMSLDKLIAALQEQAKRDKERTVYVKADKSVPYGAVIRVVDQIKVVGGIDYVALATQPERA
jgi:biopolymer transport protein ExbD